MHQFLWTNGSRCSQKKNIFCHKIDCLRVLLHEFTVLRGTFVLLLNMHMYIDMIFFYL